MEDDPARACEEPAGGRGELTHRREGRGGGGGRGDRACTREPHTETRKGRRSSTWTRCSGAVQPLVHPSVHLWYTARYTLVHPCHLLGALPWNAGPDCPWPRRQARAGSPEPALAPATRPSDWGPQHHTTAVACGRTSALPGGVGGPWRWAPGARRCPRPRLAACGSGDPRSTVGTGDDAAERQVARPRAPLGLPRAGAGSQ